MKTNLTTPIKISLFCALLILLAFIPKDNDPIDKLVTTLQKWTDTIPQEKVYLHMDKPYYALGDTIWFKGYITIGSRHQLSKLSGALYVDLISEKDSLIQTLKLPVITGMVVGDFILGDNLKEGSYHIRAYTQWMRNAGEDYFFDYTFPVGDVANNIITSADYQYKDFNGKSVLTATLNYTNDDGKPVVGKDVHYQIVINKKVVWSTSAKTDQNGNIPVKISNENRVDLSGAYITTTLDGKDKNTITRDFPIKAQLSQSDVQFFPESGNLINGITSRVAFKAVGIDGLGLNIKGKITDNDNKQITEIETLHAGMGSFLLHPEDGKAYSAQINFADGTTKTVPLPKVVTDGYVLSVYQPNKDSILIRINTKQPASPQSVNLIVHTNGEIILASPIKIEKATTSIWLEKKSFPTGIAQFTIFNNNGEPLNERIAFIKTNDQMQLDLKTVKNSYRSKEPISVSLDAKDKLGKPTFGNFSVSVIDETKMPVDEANENTIFSSILLTSDLKGYIEKPNYYFTSETDEVNKALDNLMLTQGYRRFTWKQLNELVNSKPQFPAEGLGITISGKVTTLNDKVLSNATVNMISLKAKIAKTVITNAEGRFKFDGIFLLDSIKIALQARTSKNSDKVKLILDKIPKVLVSKDKNLADVSINIAATLKTFIESSKKDDDINEKIGRLGQVHRLREVRIRAKKVDPPAYAVQGIFKVPEGHADQTLKIDDPDHCATLGICLEGLMQGVVFLPIVIDLVSYNNYPYCRQLNPKTSKDEMLPMKVIVDGNVMTQEQAADIFNNNTIEPESIVKIDVIKTNRALMSIVGGAAVMLYTNRGFIYTGYNPSTVNITPKGFNKVREFYSPKYDKPDNVDNIPDMRTTVYWNPYLKTDVSGKTSFNYFNADGPGTYKVIVEGINANGELGRQVVKYAVVAK